jgi:hypothetical protein
MPKGHKAKSGYATVDKDLGGLGYREIAERMTDDGVRMNHATARNTFLRAMEKIALKVCKSSDVDFREIDTDRVARHPEFQCAIQDIMHDDLGD